MSRIERVRAAAGKAASTDRSGSDSATVTPIRPNGEGLHPYAAAIRDAWCARLDRLRTKPWIQGDAWDTNCFVTARKLTELANSPWSGYDLGTARADYLAHAPHDHAWDKREKCWETGSTTAASDTLPAPAEGDTVPPASLLPDIEPPAELDPAAETDFWNARPILAHLHDFALSRRVSPWAVLGVSLARIVTATPFTICLPPLVGGRASLNMFVGLVGPSGSGKGAAESAAVDALHVGHIKSARIASGEAIAHVYKHRTGKPPAPEWRDNDHAALIQVAEIDRLTGQAGRQGSTIMADLRSAWSGELLGQVAADSSRSFPLEAHEYRLCLVAGIQPTRAHGILDDADGGTPQRFLWMPATYPQHPDTAPAEPRPWTWSPPNVGDWVSTGGNQMAVCETAAEVIDAANLARSRGEGDALDGHALLCQLKTAAALALAERRLDVTDEDWELAGTIAHKSAATRGRVIAALDAKKRQTNEAVAEAEAHRVIHVSERVTDDAVKRTCGAIVRKLKREGDWLSEREIGRSVKRDRKYIPEALERLAQAGQVESEETSHTTKYRLIGGPQ